MQAVGIILFAICIVPMNETVQEQIQESFKYKLAGCTRCPMNPTYDWIPHPLSYSNLRNVCMFGCVLTPLPFMDLRALNLAERSGILWRQFYHTIIFIISLCGWESGRNPIGKALVWVNKEFVLHFLWICPIMPWPVESYNWAKLSYILSEIGE